jgi:predicted GNAT superfamily acetyltransferase
LTVRDDEILIRDCEGFEELAACVQTQIDVWGYNDGDVIPRRLFVVAKKIGGQVIGAFDLAKSSTTHGEPDSLVGFAMSLPGVRNGPYLHSHMLAVQPAYRNRGLGRRLKLAQRTEALARGLDRMEWTFDPLQIKNAHLNIHKLGAVVRTYIPNFYGVSSSRLQGGLPTDRLLAEWWMSSQRVEAVLGGSHFLLPEIQETIVVPGAIHEWKELPAHRADALNVQANNRECFQRAFSQGLAVVDFKRDTEGNGIFQLGTWTESYDS